MSLHRAASIFALLLIQYIYMTKVSTTPQQMTEVKFLCQLFLSLATIFASYVLRNAFENDCKKKRNSVTGQVKVACVLAVCAPLGYIARNAWNDWTVDGFLLLLLLLSMLNIATVLSVSVATRNGAVVDDMRSEKSRSSVAD